MKTVQLILSVIVMTLVLFFWSGITQIFPWGVPSANTIRSATESSETENFQAPNLKTYGPNKFSTPEFDKEMVNNVNTLTTDRTFSWIITKPLSYYNPVKYFGFEILNQLLNAILLTALLAITIKWSFLKRVLIVAIAALLTVSGAYVQLFNWWGLTFTYAAGVSLNLLIGWLTASAVSARFILNKKE